VYWTAFNSLRVPIFLGLAATVVLVLGAFSLGNGAHEALGTTVTILGALGLTSASLYARGKAKVTALWDSLARRVHLEQARRAADLCPTAPGERRGANPVSLAAVRQARR